MVTSRDGITKELDKRQSHGTLNVKTLLSALSKTIDFEKDMKEKVGKAKSCFVGLPDFELVEVRETAGCGEKNS